jgi:hypothetical protein
MNRSVTLDVLRSVAILLVIRRISMTGPQSRLVGSRFALRALGLPNFRFVVQGSVELGYQKQVSRDPENTWLVLSLPIYIALSIGVGLADLVETPFLSLREKYFPARG